ncbi:glycosyltransferase [Rhizohabitans arisaemae]|uniref:glycosyltransferase n=1 Tax=Rhizohabitans arisaemae TaxID=2720610 RepID=UPI0024B0F4BA|nr:glycosyltransferase [Rhizohabitans arisaemae]
MAETSIIIPAHNEERVIGRLLTRLAASAGPGEFEVIVVTNGCTDRTAEIAEAHGARVVDSPIPSKWQALRLGDTVATGFPRLYVDADIEIGTDDVRALCRALTAPGILAAAPERHLPMTGRPWMVRWYYDVWTRLPDVRAALWGRGVVALTEEGNARLATLPQVIGDDLVIALAFGPGESEIVSAAKVTIHPPRTAADLMRRRIRTATGGSQIDRGDQGATVNRPKTGMGQLLRMAKAEPRLAPRVALFLGLALVAKVAARRAVRKGDYTTWLRDESSRA